MTGHGTTSEIITKSEIATKAVLSGFEEFRITWLTGVYKEIEREAEGTVLAEG